MEGKKKYVAIILFLLIGLSLFTFANPQEEEKKLDNGKEDKEEVENNDSSKEDEKEDTPSKEEDKDNSVIVENNKDKGNNNTVKNNGYDKALKAVLVAENSLSSVDSESARDLVALVTDKNLKQELASRLDAVDAAIDATKLVDALEKLVNDSLNKDDLNNAVDFRDENAVEKAVTDLTNESVKEELQTRVDALNKILNDNTAPVVSGVEDGETRNESVSVTVDEEDVKVTVTLNGTEIENADVFTLEGEYVYTVVDAAFNETVVKFTIDTTNPEFVGLVSGNHYDEITLDVSDATDVTITVVNKDTGVTEEVEVGTVLTEDATYYITAVDAAGNSSSIWVAIDTTAPVISGVSETTPTNKNEIVYVSDKFLMTVTIDGTEYTREDFTVGANNENFTFQKKVTHEGTHTVVATDKFGNTTTVTFVIDKTAPEVVSVVKSNNDKATKNDVTVTVTLNEKGVAPEGWMQVSDTEFTKVYSENGKYTVEFSDVAGNIVLAKFEVKRIDKVAPEAVVTTSNNGNPTNEDVTVTIVTNEAVYRPGDWTEVKTNKEHEWTKVYTENGTYSVVIKDKAGNETTVEFTVEGIDKEAPVYSSLRMLGGNYYKENGKHIRYATNGTIVYVYTTFAEKLAVAPTVTMNGTWAVKSYLAKEENGSYIYASAFKLNKEDGLKDGEVSIVVEGYADAAGNTGVKLTNDDITLASQKYVVIDKTPVKATLSNGTLGNNPYRKLNVKLYDANTVTSVVINGKKLPHTGKYVDINDGDAYRFLEGENVIVAKDKAGNVTEVVYVKDTKAPVAKSMAMSGGNLYKENGKVMWYVTNGSYIYVNLHFTEKLAVAPIVKLNGTVEAKLGTVKDNGDVVIYSYSYKLNKEDGLKNGLVSVEVSGYADNAGNVGEVLTNENITLASQKYVVIDKTPVEIKLVDGTIGTDPYSKLNVKLYDANGVESVVINGNKLPHKGTYVDVNDGHAYTFVEGENVIVAKDKAGNVTTATYVKEVVNTIVIEEDTTFTEITKVEKGTETVVDLKGNTLTLDGDDASRLFENEGKLTFKNGEIIQKSEQGSGVVANKGGVVVFDGVHVIDYGSYNYSTIYNQSGDVVINNSIFEVYATSGLNSSVAKCVGRKCANSIVYTETGNVTITNTTFKGNSEYAYAFVSYAGNIVFENVNIEHNRGGLGLYGGNVTLTNTNIDVPYTSNSYYGIYAANLSTLNLTINSGNIIARRNAVLVVNGAEPGSLKVTINGGTFDTRQPAVYASVSSGVASDLVITGGTFKNANVAAYLPEGYVQNTNGEVVLVSE